MVIMRVIAILYLSVLLIGCSSEDNGTSVHCFDQQKSLTLPAFVQTNCPTIADTVSGSPPSQSGTTP
jgi:PBP1b-binding outer membrane lipoprotein LpoB